MKKKIFALIMTLVMVLSLVACGGGKTEEPAKEPDAPDVSTEESENIKTFTYGDYTFEIDTSIPLEEREIVSIFENVSHPFGVCLNAGVTAGAEEFGVNAYQMGGTAWDPTESIEQIDALITKGIDGFAISAIDAEAFTAAAHRAMEAGIPVIGYNSPIPDESARLCQIGVDVYSVAKAITDPLCKSVYEVYGGGKILLFGDLAANEPVTRAQALRDSAAEYPEGTFEIIELNSNKDDATIYSDIENAFAADPDIVGAYSVSGCQYLIGKYLKENDFGNVNSDSPVFSAGHDLFEECLYNVRDGWEAYLVSQDPLNQGYKPVEVLAKFYETYDESVFEDIILDPVVVDAENVEEFIEQLEAGIPVG